MRWGRFEKTPGEPFYAIINGNRVRRISGTPFGSFEEQEELPLASLKILAPALPTKIVCVGLNYRDHAAELGMSLPEEPIIFMKPLSALLAPGEEIIYPPMVSQLDYEAELAFVIGKKGKEIKEEEAEDYIFGYTCFNDVTARDLQKIDGQWTRSKSFDTFAPLGPWVETSFSPDEEFIVRLELNGKTRQNSSTKNFIFSVRRVLSFVSRIMTLFPGDVIATGTPPGIGELRPGDRVTVDVAGIGRLENSVSQRKEA